MNRVLTKYVFFAAMLLTGGVATAQNSNIGVHVEGNVYGGGNEAEVHGHTKVKIEQVGALVEQDVYGGGALANVGSDNTKDTVMLVKGNVNGDIYGGGLGDSNHAALVLGPVEVLINGGNVGGSVFGCNNVNGAPRRAVNVTVNGGTIAQNVYGGGNLAAYSGSPIVVVNGGTVTQSVFGGGNEALVSGNTLVTVNGGTIKQDVYGGGALADVGTNASNTTTVDILGGTIERGVYGGGLGDEDHAPEVNAVVTVNIGKLNPVNSNDTIGSATLIGASVYGGNNFSGSPQYNVYVNIWKTAHTDTDKAFYEEDDRTYAIANVFGGGNAADYYPGNDWGPSQDTVHVYGCYNTVERVFGGGNAAATPGVKTIIDGGRFDQVFGGGNGEVTAADIHGDVVLQIHGGYVGQFYGASNTSGTISGNVITHVDNDGSCGDLIIGEFFCGGNFADITSGLESTLHCADGNMIINSLYGGCNQANITGGNVVLNVYGGTYVNVFGGSKGNLGNPQANPSIQPRSADITGNVTLNLYGGTIENAFGGSNVLGKIDGIITVNVIDVEDSDCPLHVTNIYGGSNLTDYEPTNSNAVSPIVNVVHAKYGVGGNVYGGSKGVVGTSAVVKANPLVNIGYDATSMNQYIPSTYITTYSSTLLASPRAIVAGSVFGGGDAAEVQGNTEILLRNRAKVFGNVYGGGNMGEVTGNTKVIVNGANE